MLVIIVLVTVPIVMTVVGIVTDVNPEHASKVESASGRLGLAIVMMR